MPNRTSPAGRLRTGLELALTGAWLRRGWLAWLLWPLSLVYRVLLAAHRALTPTPALPASADTAKVIVVGNVVAGGSGKTPVVIALVRHLQARGLSTGVVSRGYRRNTTGCREVQAGDDPAVAGDEPTLIKEVTGVPVFVAARRQEAVDQLTRHHPRTQVILSDDGLQHRGMRRDLEICVFDERGLGNGWLLPAGPLRERWPRPASWVLYSGSPPGIAGHRIQRRLSGHARRADGRHVDLRAFLAERGKPLLALAGIARPQQFFAMLNQLGVTPDKTLALPDHYDFDSFPANEYEGYDLICTEKDAKKLWPRAPNALAAELILEFEPEFLKALDERLDRLLSDTPVSSGHGYTTS